MNSGTDETFCVITGQGQLIFITDCSCVQDTRLHNRVMKLCTSLFKHFHSCCRNNTATSSVKARCYVWW